MGKLETYCIICGRPKFNRDKHKTCSKRCSKVYVDNMRLAYNNYRDRIIPLQARLTTELERFNELLGECSKDT